MIAEIGILFALYGSIRMVDMILTHKHRSSRVTILLVLCAVLFWTVALIVSVDLLVRGLAAPMPTP